MNDAARIVQRSAREVPEHAAVPLDHRGHELGNFDDGARADRVEGGPRREPHPQAADQDARGASRVHVRAAEGGERTRGRVVFTRHQVVAAGQDQVLVSADAQLERGAVGRGGVVERRPAEHAITRFA